MYDLTNIIGQLFTIPNDGHWQWDLCVKCKITCSIISCSQVLSN